MTSPRILVVDDQPDTLTALEALLSSLGHRIVTARSGEEALRRLLDEDFGVIVMDVRMPGMDGFETVELIKQRPAARGHGGRLPDRRRCRQRADPARLLGRRGRLHRQARRPRRAALQGRNAARARREERCAARVGGALPRGLRGCTDRDRAERARRRLDRGQRGALRDARALARAAADAAARRDRASRTTGGASRRRWLGSSRSAEARISPRCASRAATASCATRS